VVDVAPATFVNVVPPSVLTVRDVNHIHVQSLRSAQSRSLRGREGERGERERERGEGERERERERERETDASSSIPCHCTVGIGVPDADAMNIAVLPAVTVVELGFVAIDGGACTVSVADALVIDPAAFMNTA